VLTQGTHVTSHVEKQRATEFVEKESRNEEHPELSTDSTARTSKYFDTVCTDRPTAERCAAYHVQAGIPFVHPRAELLTDSRQTDSRQRDRQVYLRQAGHFCASAR
jgi:hypothetical protein